MNTHLKKHLLQGGLVIVSLSILTACHTVQGTVQGAGQDIQSVTNTVSPPQHHYYYHHHHHHHHHVKHTKSVSNKNMSEQSTSKQMEGNTSNSKQSQSNSSY